MSVSLTQTEGADVDAAGAHAGQAADDEEDKRLRKDGGHEAAHGVHAQAHQQHGTLPVPVRSKVRRGVGAHGGSRKPQVSVCCTSQRWVLRTETPAASPP